MEGSLTICLVLIVENRQEQEKNAKGASINMMRFCVILLLCIFKSITGTKKTCLFVCFFYVRNTVT